MRRLLIGVGAAAARGRSARSSSTPGAPTPAPWRRWTLLPLALALVFGLAEPWARAAPDGGGEVGRAPAAAPADAAIGATSFDAGAAQGGPDDASARVDADAGPPPEDAAPAAAPSEPDAAAPAAAPADEPPPVEPPAPRGPTTERVRGPVGEVRLHDRVVFVLRAPRGDRTAPDRARAATQALEAVIAHASEEGQAGPAVETRVESPSPETRVVYLGKTPLVTLGEDDVLATGEASLDVLAASVQTRVDDALTAERKRSKIATTVFSASLVVFSALLAFLLMRRMGEMAGRVRSSFADDPDRVQAFRIGDIELLSAGAARGALTMVVTLGHRFLQLALVYGWLVLGLSLFESTRPYVERLTGVVVKPLSGLVTRAGNALPLAVLAVLAALAVSAVVRFVGLFFDSVARGQTSLALVPPELARPTSVLARTAIVVGAVALAAPILTGEDSGVLSRLGTLALAATAIATVPVLANGAVGLALAFTGALERDQFLEIGRHAGHVREVGLFQVRLEDGEGCDVRVPHLYFLGRPVRRHGAARMTSVEIVVDAAANQPAVEEALLLAARELSPKAKVELLSLDRDGARYRVTSAERNAQDLALVRVLTETLARLGAGLGGGASRP